MLYKNAMKQFTRNKFIHWGLTSLLLISGAFYQAAFAQKPMHPNTAAHGASQVSYPTYPTIDYSKYSAEDVKIIQHGEYLAKIGDCIACHTNSAEGTAPFAGGLPFKTPFGIFYSPNITPDKQTGMGNWTETDFKTALRDGIGPHGNYYPVFPFVYFNQITDQDIQDLWAYFRAIPAVNLRNRKNKVAFPFNIRFLQAGWKVLFFQFHKGQFQYDPKQSAAWNRGRYLVDGLGHCAMCHSPMNLFGASDRNLYLSGNFVNGYYAPNITSATLAKYSIDEIVKVFSQEEMLGNSGKVQGPMEEVDRDSLKYLQQQDLIAIATYLKTVPAIQPKVEKVEGGSALAIGAKVYDAHCGVCHNTGAAGAPIKGNAADWKPRIAQGMDTLFKHAIQGINSMPPKGTCMSCSDDEIKDAVRYLVNEAEGKNASSSAPQPARTAPPVVDTSLELGRKVYGQSCAMCHADGKYGAPILGDKDAWEKILTQDGGMPTVFEHAINGYKLHPKKGACLECQNSDIQAAVKYIIQESIPDRNVSLW
ncbi:MAG: c-type cytochrome [Legionellales bacterium]|nr:c-type cytochrome [Legionellales bacterium]